jgi:hypothetical protein
VRGAGMTTGSEARSAGGRFLTYLSFPEVAEAVESHTGWRPFDPARATASFPVRDFSEPWPLATDLVADSVDIWLQRWSREVRGRGK